MAVTAAIIGENKPDWNDGIFLVDKPAGRTSFAIVRRIRRLLGIKKVGHAGTLDPFASGLLIVCAGRPATRHVDLFMAGRKVYLARLQLGVETATMDPEGSVVATRPVPEISETTLTACLQRHVGPQMQAPPPFSAVKHKGKPLYVYARQGVRIEKAARPIELFRLELLTYDADARQLHVEIECSRGTYIRVVAADIGRTLGCGAHLVGLRRIRSGQFAIEDCLPGEELFTDSGLYLLRSKRRSLAEVLQPAG
jgi:tRNA pseudouridine55 synthase